jgi:dUTP pyrophosphatase
MEESQSLNVKIVNKGNQPLPEYKTEQSAGMDLHADLAESIVLNPLERRLIPTGLFIELPQGIEAQVRSRSGMALKFGISVLNSPGTIDADYRGEIGVILINLSSEAYTLQPGERIAQLVLARHEIVNWTETLELSSTERGSGGFGSTNK